MNKYDIVFIGNMATATIIPFEGPQFVERNSPALFAPIAACCVGKKVAAVTKIPESQREFLEPLKTAGVDVFVESGRITHVRVVFPTANIDERQMFFIDGKVFFHVDDIPPFEPCLIHLCCFGVRGFQLELMRALKARGFRVSVDMQSFVLQTDSETGAIKHRDIPEKKRILRMADFVKLDAVEAKVLTGSDDLLGQAGILQDFGASEIIITSSEGVLARDKQETAFARFTNRNNQGRMGRGDTVMGSYLAHRLEHSLADSLRFAVALASIKLESVGPFKGSIEEVFTRMQNVRIEALA